MIYVKMLQHSGERSEIAKYMIKRDVFVISLHAHLQVC